MNTKDEQQLRDWREMFEAFAQLPLPVEHRTRKLWPNKWHKDCAVVAFTLHEAAMDADIEV